MSVPSRFLSMTVVPHFGQNFQLCQYLSSVAIRLNLKWTYKNRDIIIDRIQQILWQSTKPSLHSDISNIHTKKPQGSILTSVNKTKPWHCSIRTGRAILLSDSLSYRCCSCSQIPLLMATFLPWTWMSGSDNFPYKSRPWPFWICPYSRL